MILTLVAELQIPIVCLTLGKLFSKLDEFFMLFSMYSPYIVSLFYMRPRLL
jgi:hypothetical protein